MEHLPILLDDVVCSRDTEYSNILLCPRMYDDEENERSIGESDCTHSEDAESNAMVYKFVNKVFCVIIEKHYLLHNITLLCSVLVFQSCSFLHRVEHTSSAR